MKGQCESSYDKPQNSLKCSVNSFTKGINLGSCRFFGDFKGNRNLYRLTLEVSFGVDPLVMHVSLEKKVFLELICY